MASGRMERKLKKVTNFHQFPHLADDDVIKKQELSFSEVISN